jgi:hypothetical protein
MQRRSVSIPTPSRVATGLNAIVVAGNASRGSFDAFHEAKANHIIIAFRRVDPIVLGHHLDTSKNPRTFEADVIPCGMLRGGDHGDGRSWAFRF